MSTVVRRRTLLNLPFSLEIHWLCAIHELHLTEGFSTYKFGAWGSPYNQTMRPDCVSSHTFPRSSGSGGGHTLHHIWLPHTSILRAEPTCPLVARGENTHAVDAREEEGQGVSFACGLYKTTSVNLVVHTLIATASPCC